MKGDEMIRNQSLETPNVMLQGCLSTSAWQISFKFLVLFNAAAVYRDIVERVKTPSEIPCQSSAFSKIIKTSTNFSSMAS